jgi:nucleoid DNA-binding protein
MNKLELIKALRDECQISKNEAAAVSGSVFEDVFMALDCRLAK